MMACEERTEEGTSLGDLIFHAFLDDAVDVGPVRSSPVCRIRAYSPGHLAGNPVRDSSGRCLAVNLERGQARNVALPIRPWELLH